MSTQGMRAAISATHAALSKTARKTNAPAAVAPSFAKLARSIRPSDWKTTAATTNASARSARCVSGALLHLGRLRRPLEQEDVRERVARAEHGHALSARGAGDLVAELVDLENGLLQVFLVDLVGGNGTHGGSFQVSRLADSFLGLRDPLERLEVDERLRPAEPPRRAQADEGILRALESAHPQRTGAESLEHVRVGAGAHRQVVLRREPQRLVVVGLEEQPRVVDLEDVDVGEVPLERRRVGDRVQAVEGVGEVDEPALGADCGDRLLEGEAAG